MTEYLNKSDRCIVCFGSPKDTKLIKHHVSYFPEKIAFVHYECHQKIHNSKFSPFIQYNDGDSRMYYNMKENKDESGSTIKVRLESQ